MAAQFAGMSTTGPLGMKLQMQAYEDLRAERQKRREQEAKRRLILGRQHDLMAKGRESASPHAETPPEPSTLPSNGSGYWTRAAVVAMDNRALARLATCHPAMAPPPIKLLLANLRKPELYPEFKPNTGDQILGELFEALPENSNGVDISRYELDRIQVETAKIIRQAVAAKHRITLNDMDASCRSRKLACARHEAMYLVARECPMLSYPRMGRMFGGKDHTSIIHGVRKHADRNGLPRVRESGA